MSVFEMNSMLEVFEGSLEFHWGPHNDEPTIIANKIDLLRESLEDAEAPMLASVEIIVEDMQDRFDREVDLDGIPWQGLEDKYDKWKQQHAPGKKKLTLSDDLVHAVTNRYNYEVVNNNMLINTTTWPPYWHAHDVGSTVGKGVKLPARPFMGMSLEAQFAIVAIFDEWIDTTLDIIVSPITGVAVFRGEGGRFAAFTMGRPRASAAGKFGRNVEPSPGP